MVVGVGAERARPRAGQVVVGGEGLVVRPGKGRLGEHHGCEGQLCGQVWQWQVCVSLEWQALQGVLEQSMQDHCTSMPCAGMHPLALPLPLNPAPAACLLPPFDIPACVLPTPCRCACELPVGVPTGLPMRGEGGPPLRGDPGSGGPPAGFHDPMDVRGWYTAMKGG